MDNKRNKKFYHKERRTVPIWILSPTEENHIAYKTIRNKVTPIIRTEKKQGNFDALGPNPSPKKIYATLKSKKTIE